VRHFGFLRNMPVKAKIGAGILGLFIVLAIIGPYLAPFNPADVVNTSTGAHAPTWTHLFGTVPDGGDVFSQWMVSIRGTVELGLLTACIASVLTVGVGVTAGFLGGLADEGLSLLMNIFIVLPALPLLIIVLTFLPQSGVLTIALVLALLGWSWGARVIRAQTLTLRGRDFVAAARENGERTWRLVVFEVLPNEVSLIAANFVGTFLYAILTSVALAFIGVTPTSTWTLGAMLYWAQSADAFIAGQWWMYVPPGLAVAVLGMSLVLINFGLDEFGNPRLRDPTGHVKRPGSHRRRAWRPTDPTPVELAESAA
jgi:peptide/nickel transport system permease protein